MASRRMFAKTIVILVGFDELIFHTDNMKILKVLDD